MKRIAIALLTMVVITGAYSGRAWAPDMVIGELMPLCTVEDFLSNDATKYWITKHDISTTEKGICIFGKMSDTFNFGDYWSFTPGSDTLHPSASSFRAVIFDSGSSSVTATKPLMCVVLSPASVTSGQSFFCATTVLSSDAALPDTATLKLNVQKSFGADDLRCDSYPSTGSILIAAENGNCIPDDVATDADGDGVADGLDLCPFTAGTDKNGCVEADGDGVPDDEDACADTPAGASVNDVGCPDTDGDGVYDNLDTCPSTPVDTVVDASGCPVAGDADSDGDGVLDSADNCPTTYNPDQANVDGDEYGDECDTSGVTTDDTTAATTVSEGGMCAMMPMAAFNPMGLAFIAAALAAFAVRKRR